MELPTTWELVDFDEAITVISDRGLRIKQKDYLSTGQLAIVDQGEGLVGGYTDDANARVESSEPIIVFGDHTRRFKYVSFPFAVGADGVKLFSANSFWNSKFLFQQLTTLDLEDRGYGRHYQDLRKKQLAIPPLEEQNRIVAKLEELLSDLDAGVAELKAAQKKLKQYRQSLLKAAVEGTLTAAWREAQRKSGAIIETGAQLLERALTERRTRWEETQLAKFKGQGKAPPKNWKKNYPEPVRVHPDTTNYHSLPDGWVWATLSQVGWLDRGRSKHRPRNAPHLYGGPYPFVQTGDIRHADTYLSDAEVTYSEAGLEQSRLWPTGTMCITIAANIGKTAILSMEACFPDSVVGFLPSSNDVSIRYVEYFMRSVQQKLEDDAPATAQKNINLEILKRTIIPIPTYHEQQQIVILLDETMESAREGDRVIARSLKQSTAQRQNILRAAFSGELVPQNPNDEPASVLLERIRTERDKKAIAKKTRSHKSTKPM